MAWFPKSVWDREERTAAQSVVHRKGWKSAAGGGGRGGVAAVSVWISTDCRGTTP